MAKTRTGQSRQIVAKWIRDMMPKKCCNCGATKSIQYHHIVPVIYGGNEVPSNVVALCSDCHSKVHYGRGGVINHGDAVKKGIAAAKEHGVRVGRKPANGERIMRIIAENSTQFNMDSTTTETEIMEMLGIKSVCYHKYKRQLIDLMESDAWPYSWQKPTRVRNYPLYDGVIKKLRSAL